MSVLKGVQEIAQRLEKRISTQRSEAAIVELDEKTDLPLEPILKLQYFPASISDSYTTNYVAQNIPGGSLPLYQWVGGGPRTISFEAIFTCDTDLLHNGPSKSVQMNARLKNMQQEDRNIDIRVALIWLKRFMLPRYVSESGGPAAALTYAPRKLQLVMINSGIGLIGGTTLNQGPTQNDSIYCHMTQCEITYQMFHPSGLPKIVKVNLAFEQIAQIAGNVIFPSADGLDLFMAGSVDKSIDPALATIFGGNTIPEGYFQYPLKATGRAKNITEENVKINSGLVNKARDLQA